MKTTNAQRRQPPVDSSTDKPAPKGRAKRTRASEAPKPAGGLFIRTDITPEELFTTFGRKRIEGWIERLIEIVDEADGDLESEPDPVEQNLAAVNGHEQCNWDHDDAEADTVDYEPSLGFIEDHHYQQGLSRGAYADSDLEDEHDGREPDDEGELASGIGDFDGLMEQCPGSAGSGASSHARYVE